MRIQKRRLKVTSLGKRFVVLMLILSLTLGGLATYFLSKNSCYRNNYIINIDKQSKQLLSQVFKAPLPTMSTRGFVVSGTNIAVHVLVGDIFEYKNMVSVVEGQLYGKCVPVISRYEIDKSLQDFIFPILSNYLKVYIYNPNPRLLDDLVNIALNPSVIHSGTFTELFYYLNNSVLKLLLLKQYLYFPDITKGEKDWLNGRVYPYPIPEYLDVFNNNELVKSQNIYRFAILGFKFPTYKRSVALKGIPSYFGVTGSPVIQVLDLKNLSHEEYTQQAEQAYMDGLKSILGMLKSSNGVARTILLPALNTPAFPYSWVGEAQALAIREMAAKQSLKINVVRHYDRLDNSPDYYHIFFVVFDQDAPIEQSAYISGIKKGFTEDIFTPEGRKFILYSLLIYLISFFGILLLTWFLFLYLKKNIYVKKNTTYSIIFTLLSFVVAVIFTIVASMNSFQSPVQTGFLIGGTSAFVFLTAVFFRSLPRINKVSE